MSQPNPDKLPGLGFLLLAALTLFWGVNFPVMKTILQELPPWTFRTVCLSLGGLGLLVISRLSGASLTIPRSDLKPLLSSALFAVTGWHLFSAYGLIHLPAGRAVIIGYTMPLWASLLGVFILGERLNYRRTAGLVLGLGGLAVLIGPDLKALGDFPLGAGFMVGAAWCWALGSVLIKRGPWTMPLVLVTAWMFILGGIPVFVGAFLFENPIVVLDLSRTGILLLAYAILLPMLFCHWAYFKVVTLFPVSLASIRMLAAPILGVYTGAAFLGEPVGIIELSALVLVVGGLAVVMIRPGRT